MFFTQFGIGYFDENNFTAKYLMVPTHTSPNTGDLLQREHPKIRVEYYYDAVKISVLCVISAFERSLM